MNNLIPLLFAALMALAIIVIGGFYLLAPGKILGSFGLRPPAAGADTLAWLRLKGVRDIASGLVVLTTMLIGDPHLVGVVLLVEAVVPLGDMSVVFSSGGSKSQALSVHGATCAAMLVVGLFLIHAF